MDPLTIVMLAILALLIFFMIRNSRKRRADTEALQDKMQPGAEVMTNFGLFGTLVEIDEETNIAVLETGPGSTVRVHRQTLARVIEDEVAEDEVVEDELEAETHEDPAAGPRMNESSVDPKKSTD